MADPFAAESVSVRSHAAVVDVVASVSLSGLAALRFPAECIVATSTDDETLKQVLGATLRLPIAFPILFQSFCHGSEEFLADDGRNWNRNPLILGHLIDGDRPSRLFRAALLCPQTRPFRPDSPLTEDRVSTIRGILEVAPHRRASPITLARGRRDALFLQATTDLADRQAVTSSPREHLLYHARLFEHDLVTRFAVSFARTHVTITVRRAAENTDRALTRGM